MASPTGAARVLVTNDDGVNSPGLWALAQAARDAGLENVVVAAPSWDSSGASASLTAVEAEGRLLMEQRRVESLPDVPVHAVEAAPAYIVRAAIEGAFGPPPTLVLSGINLGLNVGYQILHSGTVGAVLTAATYGRNGMAVSLARGRGSGRRIPHWDTAAQVARFVLPWLVESGEKVSLNVNVPAVPVEDLQGVRRGRLSSLGMVQTTVTELHRDHVHRAFAQPDAEREPGSDAALIDQTIASYTLLAPCEADLIDTSGLPGQLPTHWTEGTTG